MKEKIVEYVKKKYEPQLVLLYGSLVTETFTDASDINLIVFSRSADKLHDSSFIENYQLDAWVYNFDDIKNLELVKHILPCEVLYDSENLSDSLISSLINLRKQQTITLNKNDFFQLKNWILKMLKRSEQNSTEGLYRFNLMLNDLPELYCSFKGIYYSGPIKTLNYLKINDSEIFNIYHSLLENKNRNDLKNLYNKIIAKSVFMESIEEIILEFIKSIELHNNIKGCMICGSYASGEYDLDSDIDILFIVDGNEFDMRLVMYKDTLFDCMFVSPKIVMELLNQESALSNILSLSFGLNQKVILDSMQIQSVVKKATENIQERALRYQKTKNKPKKVVDDIPYTVKMKDGIYYLYKNQVKVI